MEPFRTIRVDIADGLATITLSRPEKRNAMTREMLVELGDAVDTLGADPAVRAVLVAAEGPSFCAGLDLGVVAELAGVSGDGLQEFVAVAQRPYRSLATMPKPTLAAVRGHALGAGFQLALACDLRILSSDATFAMLEARYGLVPDLGGIHHLARIVGPAMTKELIWTTRSVDAAEAERLGLAGRVVPSDQLEEAARVLAGEVMAHSPTAAGLAKALVDGAFETSLADQLVREAAAQARCLEGDDHQEAVAAFLERRPPRFGAPA